MAIQIYDKYFTFTNKIGHQMDIEKIKIVHVGLYHKGKRYPVKLKPNYAENKIFFEHEIKKSFSEKKLLHIVVEWRYKNCYVVFKGTKTIVLPMAKLKQTTPSDKEYTTRTPYDYEKKKQKKENWKKCGNRTKGKSRKIKHTKAKKENEFLEKTFIIPWGGK